MKWIKIEDEKPPLYRNVLLAFGEHWNQVVGFRTGNAEYYETSAHDHNSRIRNPLPLWWAGILEVPHRANPALIEQPIRKKSIARTKK